MPQRTPAHTSQQEGSSTGGNHRPPSSTGGNKQHAASQPNSQNISNASTNIDTKKTISNSSSNTIGSSSCSRGTSNQQQMLNLNNNMFTHQLFQSSSNSTGNDTPSSSSTFQFHNLSSVLPSSNKKRKHEFVNYGSSSSQPTENSLFYHIQTDFKRKAIDKKRLVWTNELHECFMNAVNQLGINDARPKEILELMGLPDLTTTHIKSHLQKYRQQVKKGFIPTNPSNIEEGTSSESEGTNEDLSSIKETQTVETHNSHPFYRDNQVNGLLQQHSIATSNNNNSGSNNNMYNNVTNNISSQTQSTTPNSQSLNSLMNDTNSDQVNYIKNILLHFNQLSNTNGNTNNHSQPYIPTSSYSLPPRTQQNHLTIANSITTNNITNVNQPNFYMEMGDGSSILNNCHLFTSANSLSEFLVLLQEICKTEDDIAKIFNNLPVQSTNDLNLIVEGFRLGFICGVRFKP